MLSMLDYIYKESEINQKIINHPSLIPNSIYEGKNYRDVVIFATGSSSNAAHSAKHLMQDILSLPVYIKEPSLSINYEENWNSDTLYLAISQGGSSASMIHIVEYLQKRNINVYAITSNLESPFAKKAMNVMELGMEIETMPYVTAGYSATIVFLWLLSIELAKNSQIISANQANSYTDAINRVISKIDHIIERTQEWYNTHKAEFIGKNRFVFIGYGATFGSALEAATKFTEILHAPAQGYELEEYMHGPYLGLGKGDLLFLIDSKGKLSQRSLLLRKFLDRHMDKTYVVTLNETPYQEQDLSFGIDIPEHMSSLLLTIPFHIMSYHLSQEMGINLNVSYYPEFDDITKSKI